MHVPVRSGQCRVMVNATSEEAGNGMPVGLICLPLLGHCLAKKMNIQNVTGEYLVWVGFSQEARISLHLFVF